MNRPGWRSIKIGARLCAKRQAQQSKNAAVGFQHIRAPSNYDAAALKLDGIPAVCFSTFRDLEEVPESVVSGSVREFVYVVSDERDCLMKYYSCPGCQSTKTTLTDAFPSSGMQALKNRVCLDCGTAWRPACPRIVGIALLVLGVLVVVLGNALAKEMKDVHGLMNQPAKSDSSDWMYPVMGCIAGFCGLSALFGPAAKIKILGKQKTKG